MAALTVHIQRVHRNSKLPIKHYATSHNLREPHEKSIQNANDFVEHVQKYTEAIKIIHLQDVEVEEFRKVKNVDWLAIRKYPGIQKTHL